MLSVNISLQISIGNHDLYEPLKETANPLSEHLAADNY
jgi:hypothetical protein